MNVRTFAAASMAEALEQVKRGIGSDAVVLHTRTYKRGGFLGIGAKTVVEVTAADGRELGKRRAREAKQSPRAQRLAQARAAKPVAVAANPQSPLAAYAAYAAQATATNANNTTAATAAIATTPDSQTPAGDLIRKTYLAAQAQLAQNNHVTTPAVATLPTETVSPAAPSTLASDPIVNVQPLPTHANQLAQEMQAVRGLVAKLMHQQARADGQRPAATGDALFQQYLALIEHEVAEELADQIVDQARTGITELDTDDTDACHAAVRRAIEQVVEIDANAGSLDAPPDNSAADSRPGQASEARVIALVGPTGVGKTTTVAKLAATFKLKQAKDVAFITLDTYRIAAVDQLRTYAEILGVPLEVVNSPDEMTAAVAKHRHRDAILIDTAGRSQRDDAKLTELAAFIQAAKPHETHLVLSSTATQRVLLETVERFAPIDSDRIIFTKLDEAVTFGTLLSVAAKVGKKLSYVTTGQEVPHQIEPGDPARLAALVMGDSEL